MKRTVATLVTAVMLMLPQLVASPAHAWPWDSHVKVAGRVGCGPWYARYAASSVTIRLDNGATSYAGVANYGAFGTYGMDFWGVPGSIGATTYVNCRWHGTWTRRVTIYRPGIGIQQNLDLWQ